MLLNLLNYSTKKSDLKKKHVTIEQKCICCARKRTKCGLSEKQNSGLAMSQIIAFLLCIVQVKSTVILFFWYRYSSVYMYISVSIEFFSSSQLLSMKRSVKKKTAKHPHLKLIHILFCAFFHKDPITSAIRYARLDFIFRKIASAT